MLKLQSARGSLSPLPELAGASVFWSFTQQTLTPWGCGFFKGVKDSAVARGALDTYRARHTLASAGAEGRPPPCYEVRGA